MLEAEECDVQWQQKKYEYSKVKYWTCEVIDQQNCYTITLSKQECSGKESRFVVSQNVAVTPSNSDSFVLSVVPYQDIPDAVRVAFTESYVGQDFRERLVEPRILYRKKEGQWRVLEDDRNVDWRLQNIDEQREYHIGISQCRSHEYAFILPIAKLYATLDSSDYRAIEYFDIPEEGRRFIVACYEENRKCMQELEGNNSLYSWRELKELKELKEPEVTPLATSKGWVFGAADSSHRHSYLIWSRGEMGRGFYTVYQKPDLENQIVSYRSPLSRG